MLKRLWWDFLFLTNPNYIRSVFFMTVIALKKQYRESFLGTSWSLIQPAVQIVILATVFSLVMRFPIENYALYVMSGILPWNLMILSFTSGAVSLVDREAILKRCIIPRTMFVMSDTLVHVYLFFVSFAVMYGLLLLFGAPWHWSVLSLPLAVLPVGMVAIAGAHILAYMSPYVRDVSHLLTVALGSLFWTVPVAYPMVAIPETYQHYFLWNPFYMLLRPMQMAVYDGVVPGFDVMAPALGVASTSLILAFLVQRKLRSKVIFYL